MDVIGSVAVVFAIGLVVLAIIEVPARGWSDPVVVAGFGLGVVATAVFVVWELRVDHPLLDVRFFARRGFGSGSFSITIQFLVESVVLSSTGGLLGILFGVGVPVVVTFFSEIDSYIQWWTMPVTFLISVGIGVVFGVYPARQAAMLDPIEALRHE